MYSTRKFWRLLAVAVFIALLAGKVPWAAVTAKLGLKRLEPHIRRVERRIGETLQYAVDRIDNGVRDWVDGGIKNRGK